MKWLDSCGFVKSGRLTPYFFMAPALLILGSLMIFPILQVIEYSFYDNVIVTSDSTFVGFDNYKELAFDPIFWTSIFNTIIFTVGSVVGHLVVGIFLALLINSPIHPVPRAIFRTLLVLPWLFTAVVVALNWQLLLHPFGIINYALKDFGIIDSNVDWLGDESVAMATLLVISIWRGYPFLMISFLSGLQSIDKSMYEAAKIDGAGWFRIFFSITIPQLKPIIYGVALLDLIWTFQLFPLVWLTTGGGPGRATEVLSTYTYRFAFVDFEFSKASTVAVILLTFTAVLTILYLRKGKSEI